MALEIKVCSPSDLKKIQQISIETFKETFSHCNTSKNINSYISKTFSLKQLEQELLNRSSYFYFAYLDGEIAGYLKLNNTLAQTEQTIPDSIEIERIYIRSAFKRKGIGKYLVNKALDFTEKTIRKEYGLVSGKKMGFYQTGTHSFFMGNDKQKDFVMEKILIKK